jgi:hypothetical protein
MLLEYMVLPKTKQVDFAVIRLLADLLVTGYSTVWFIQVSHMLLFSCMSFFHSS